MANSVAQTRPAPTKRNGAKLQLQQAHEPRKDLGSIIARRRCGPVAECGRRALQPKVSLPRGRRGHQESSGTSVSWGAASLHSMRPALASVGPSTMELQAIRPSPELSLFCRHSPHDLLYRPRPTPSVRQRPAGGRLDSMRRLRRRRVAQSPLDRGCQPSAEDSPNPSILCVCDCVCGLLIHTYHYADVCPRAPIGHIACAS